MPGGIDPGSHRIDVYPVWPGVVFDDDYDTGALPAATGRGACAAALLPVFLPGKARWWGV
ncbi:MAG TPA: hypothetical protein ENO24_10270 [Chloroflexi bacterium]|nr:hypothetical protein [Chloroflexota bacterium]